MKPDPHSYLLSIALIALACLAAPGCGSAEDEEPYGGEIARSDRQRITSPQVSSADLDTLVSGNSAFAFDVYRRAPKEAGNLFYSPHSISIALAMTHAGARNNTEKQMADALNYLLPQTQLHPAFNALDLELAERGQGKKGQDGGAFRLNVVNATWGQRGYSFLPAYLDTLALHYDAGLRLLDFESDPEQSRIVINDWVEHKTEGRIKDLIPEKVITTLTRLVLTNAITFNAAWKKAFEEENTRPDTFHLLDGKTEQVPMMAATETLGYTKGSGFQAVALPYDGDELSMLIIVPDEGQFQGFETTLDSTIVEQIAQDLAPTRVVLSLPKFRIESTLPIKTILQDLGMTDAFGLEADFSGIDGTQKLYIQDVLHKAFVNVNEAGTEAAAATAVVIGQKSAVVDQAELKIDRPFVFLIRDHQTGAILFVGRMVKPRT